MFLRMDIGSLDYILKTSTKMDAMCDLTCYWDEHKQRYKYNTCAKKIDFPLVSEITKRIIIIKPKFVTKKEQ